MKDGWANAALAGLIAFESATGLFGLVAGSPDRAIYIVLHNVGAFAILAVVGWKAVIIFRSLKTRRSGGVRTASLTLMVLTLLTVGLGFAWPVTGFFRIAGITGLNLHMFIGVALAPLALWHALTYTRGLKVGVDADRRAALRWIASAAAGAGLWLAFEGALRVSGAAGASRRFTGSHQQSGPHANAFPVTSWLNDRPAPVDRDAWRLRVHGSVANEFAIDHAELTELAGDGDAMTATLDCTGGWYADRRWQGVRLSKLLDRAMPERDARSVTFTSVTGYYRRASLEEAAGYLLATRVNDEPLTPRARCAAATRGARQARLRMGEVGERYSSQPHLEVATAASTATVTTGREDALTLNRRPSRPSMASWQGGSSGAIPRSRGRHRSRRKPCPAAARPFQASRPFR